MPSTTNLAENLERSATDETSPIPASGTVPTFAGKSGPEDTTAMPAPPSPTNATPADKPITFHDIEALLNLGERLQESVFLKKQRVQLFEYAMWMILALCLGTQMFCVWMVLDVSKNGPAEFTSVTRALAPILITTTALAGLTIIAFRQMKLRAQELLRRDEMALTDVADMLREGDVALRQKCSPLGQFFMRVQTWRLDIGVNPDPRIPRTPGIRPSHIPFEKIPPRT